MSVFYKIKKGEGDRAYKAISASMTPLSYRDTILQCTASRVLRFDHCMDWLYVRKLFRHNNASVAIMTYRHKGMRQESSQQKECRKERDRNFPHIQKSNVGKKLQG